MLLDPKAIRASSHLRQGRRRRRRARGVVSSLDTSKGASALSARRAAVGRILTKGPVTVAVAGVLLLGSVLGLVATSVLSASAQSSLDQGIGIQIVNPGTPPTSLPPVTTPPGSQSPPVLSTPVTPGVPISTSPSPSTIPSPGPSLPMTGSPHHLWWLVVAGLALVDVGYLVNSATRQSRRRRLAPVTLSSD
jgi:hypothetical protein